MKITKEELKQIIQQEYKAVLNEGDPQSRAISRLEDIGMVVKEASRIAADPEVIERLERAEELIQTLWEEMQGLGDDPASSKEQEFITLRDPSVG